MTANAPVRTTCAYCGVGCGVLATPRPDGSAEIKGDPEHPANFGRLCTKGVTLGETLGQQDRLLHPAIGGRRASWAAATRTVADTFNAAIREHGPDSVAFYVSGQLLTEDYYVSNKLMKGFIGSANIDTNSRLCMASAVAGHVRAFGADVVPCNYTDLESADLVVLVGSNMAWCHPVLFQRLLAARQSRGTKLVVIDPQRTATTAEADLHLPLKPGSDVALFNGLLAHLYSRGVTDPLFVFRQTSHLADTLLAAQEWSISRVAAQSGLDDDLVRRFYDLFARTRKTVTAFSMGVNQSKDGTDKVNAIINCHLLTGRIGHPGAGPFSLTGQPNAMGGREVGGLANMLAAHMDLQNSAHRRIVQEHWQSPRMATRPGLKAVDMFQAVLDGRIKALWIMATNPAVSMPQSGVIAEALKACPFVVVSDVTARTETAQYAHVLLPAAGWGEKDGTVTNSERRISRQRKFLPLPGETRPDWKIVSDIAAAMGFEGFNYRSPAEIFREHAALSNCMNDGSRGFEMGALAAVDDAAYEAMTPVQWLRTPFSDGKSFHAGGRFRFVTTPFIVPESHPEKFLLNTGRQRDQWHTMTRTGRVPRLFAACGEPYLRIHPADAGRLSIQTADIARVEAGDESMLLRVMVMEGIGRGEVFAPMHWSSPFASCALVNRAASGSVDPVSGQPGLKRSPVSIRKFHAAWYGFAVSRTMPKVTSEYWAIRPLEQGFAVEFAGSEPVADHASSFAGLSGDLSMDCVVSSFEDKSRGEWRAAAYRGEALTAAVFFSRTPVEVDRDFVTAALHSASSKANEVLSGRPILASNEGAVVCICNGIRQSQIDAAIERYPDLLSLCEATGAGTACGSCRPALRKRMDDNLRFRAAAE